MKEKEDKIRECLLQEARKAGICSEGERQMSALGTLSAMIGYYVKNPDWCLERDFPSKKLLGELTSVANKTLEDNGVFVDRIFHGELLNEKQVYIFHDCRGWIKTGLDLEKELLPMMYFGNNCHMLVKGDGIKRLLPIQIPLYTTTDTVVDYKPEPGVIFSRYNIEKL